MKTLYIFLTRSGTLVSNLVYALTGAEYTHISLAFDENLNTLYSSTRKNGYTMFPAGPSREYLNKGVFRLRENIPCALYALEVPDEAYARAKRRAELCMLAPVASGRKVHMEPSAWRYALMPSKISWP
mgnify:CR=1 FL=1